MIRERSRLERAGISKGVGMFRYVRGFADLLSVLLANAVQYLDHRWLVFGRLAHPVDHTPSR